MKMQDSETGCCPLGQERPGLAGRRPRNRTAARRFNTSQLPSSGGKTPRTSKSRRGPGPRLRMEPRPTTVSSKARQTPRQSNVAPCFARDTFALAPEEGRRGQGCLWTECTAQPEQQAHGALQVNEHRRPEAQPPALPLAASRQVEQLFRVMEEGEPQARGIRTALLWI